MEKDLMMLCRLWYITRETTQGQPVTPEMGEALKAFDQKVQEVVNKIEGAIM
jgi:hypothetical protein